MYIALISENVLLNIEEILTENMLHAQFHLCLQPALVQLPLKVGRHLPALRLVWHVPVQSHRVRFQQTVECCLYIHLHTGGLVGSTASSATGTVTGTLICRVDTT